MFDFIFNIDFSGLPTLAVLLAIISLAESEELPAVKPVMVTERPSRKPASRTGLVFPDDCLLHRPDSDHPDQPERLTAIMQWLENAGLLARLEILQSAPASREWLAAVHDEEYIAEVEAAVSGKVAYMHTPDTPLSSGSWKAALAAAGGVLAAVDAVMADRVVNAFCAVRPPGHHAHRNRAMGFCLFNNAALGARYVQMRHGMNRVLIVDWDVHHGNGTQDIFRGDRDVLCFSAHQFPFYPGTGGPDDSGNVHAGGGGALNAPLPAGSGDQEYERVLEEILRPRAKAFHPDFIVIAAGFDAHERDPLGGMSVTTAGFAAFTRIVRQIAAELCQGRLISILEGGYNLEALPEAVAAHIGELIPP